MAMAGLHHWYPFTIRQKSSEKINRIGGKLRWGQKERNKQGEGAEEWEIRGLGRLRLLTITTSSI